VLYRWRSVPTCCVVYVRPVKRRERIEVYAAA
jgi:hypothetical protein